jgi:hypothetical protein
MGSGPRFTIRTIPGIVLGIYYFDFPFKHTVIIDVLCFSIQFGLGRAYDETDRI